MVRLSLRLSKTCITYLHDVINLNKVSIVPMVTFALQQYLCCVIMISGNMGLFLALFSCFYEHFINSGRGSDLMTLNELTFGVTTACG